MSNTVENSTRPSLVTVPENAHPLTRLMYQLMKNQAVTYDELEFRSGVLRTTMKSHRGGTIPLLRSIEALLGSFGWELIATPPLSSLSERVLERLDDIGRMLRDDLGNEVIEAATAAVAHRDCPEATERTKLAG